MSGKILYMKHLMTVPHRFNCLNVFIFIKTLLKSRLLVNKFQIDIMLIEETGNVSKVNSSECSLVCVRLTVLRHFFFLSLDYLILTLIREAGQCASNALGTLSDYAAKILTLIERSVEFNILKLFNHTRVKRTSIRQLMCLIWNKQRKNGARLSIHSLMK